MLHMKTIALWILCFLSSLSANIKEDQLKDRVCNILPSINGWCSKEKALNFIDLVLEVKPQVCVEIGVYGGSSLFPVASALKFLDDGVIIGIDPWDKLECVKYFDPIEDKINLDSWIKADLDWILKTFLLMLKRNGLEEYCFIMKMSSEKAASQIETIDILYLDGNFSEEGSLLDVRLYLPKVRSGGYIWMNDALSPKRTQAGELLLEACDVVKFIDSGSCILYKKR